MEVGRCLIMKIEVFGTGCLLGCFSCKIPIEGVRQALAELGLEGRVVKVDDALLAEGVNPLRVHYTHV